jgi:hypothetical protein
MINLLMDHKISVVKVNLHEDAIDIHIYVKSLLTEINEAHNAVSGSQNDNYTSFAGKELENLHSFNVVSHAHADTIFNQKQV